MTVLIVSGGLEDDVFVQMQGNLAPELDDMSFLDLVKPICNEHRYVLKVSEEN